MIKNYDSKYEKERITIIENLVPAGCYQSLDVGCGTGHFSNIMDLKGHSVIGVDIDTQNIEFAKSQFKNNKKVSFLACDVMEIKGDTKIGAHSYDFICALEIIEHLTDYNQFIRDLVSLLRVGGQLLISSPNLMSLEGLNGRLWGWRTGKPFTAWDNSHKHIFSSFEFINALKKHHLKIQKIVGYHFGTIDKLPLIKCRISIPFSSTKRFPVNLFGFNTIIVAKKIK